MGIECALFRVYFIMVCFAFSRLSYLFLALPDVLPPYGPTGGGDEHSKGTHH